MCPLTAQASPGLWRLSDQMMVVVTLFPKQSQLKRYVAIDVPASLKHRHILLETLRRPATI